LNNNTKEGLINIGGEKNVNAEGGFFPGGGEEEGRFWRGEISVVK